MELSLKQRIENKLDRIGTEISSTYKNHNNINKASLLCGLPGIVLLFTQFYDTTDNDFYKKKSIDLFKSTLKIIEIENPLLPTFCDGLAGIGWLFLYLNNKKIIKISNLVNVKSFLNELDLVLIKSMNKLLENEHFDLMHGVLGIGLYFLKRRKNEEVSKICNALFESCENLDDEIKWKRFDKYKSKEYIYDFGLAHGNAGILYFLGKCYKNNISAEKCKKLIQGGINFYLHNIQDSSIAYNFYPYSIAIKDYNSKNNIPKSSRIAWCYGDLGILHTLLLLSIWINDKQKITIFEDLLLALAKKKRDEKTLLKDSQFCHGMSGVGYIFLSTFQLTKNEQFKKAADYWAKEVLNNGNNENLGLAGYLFRRGENIGWSDTMNILSGVGGVGLFLSSYQNGYKKFDWDECFFLS